MKLLTCIGIDSRFFFFLGTMVLYVQVDFELSPDGRTRNILLRATKDDWLENFNMILQWSPYKTKSELLDQVS